MSATRFAVFYCRYRDDHSAEIPTPVELEQIPKMAFDILEALDDFFGIVDRSGTTLQIMVEEEGYWVEIPQPAEEGSIGGYLDRDVIEKLLNNLPSEFHPSDIPGATFKKW